jgi:hypothetical protein
MSTGNVMGKLITPTTTSAPGIWNLREHQLAVQAGTWTGLSEVTAADSTPNSNILSMRTIGIPGATNSVFRDDSTNNFAVTRAGDVTQGTFSPYFPSGYWSGYFDGSGDYLTIPDNTALQMGTGNFTYEFWWFPTSFAGYQTLFSKGGNQAGSIIMQTDTGTGKTLVASGGSYIISTTSAAATLNTWNHVALVRSGTTLTVYLNGASVGSGTLGSNLNNTSAMAIGIDNLQGLYAIQGYISNFRAVKGSAVYVAAFTPPTTPLTAITNTSLLCLQDSRFKDNSTNNFTVTKVGDAAVARFSPFAPPRITAAATSTGSVYFSGSGSWLTTPKTSSTDFGTGSFTIEGWFNTTVTTRLQIADQYSGDNAGSWGVTLSATGTRTVEFYHGNTIKVTSPANAWNVGTWNHFAIVRSGTTLTCYLNGVSVGTSTNSENITGGNSTLFIGYTGGTAPAFNGYLSNIRIVKGTAVYTSAFTPSTTPLTAISGTSLLTCQSASTVTDASSNTVVITKVGTANANEVAPFSRVTYSYGGSGYFDGTGDYLSMPSNAAFGFGTGDYTIEMWVNPASWSTNYVPFFRHSATGGLSFSKGYNANTLIVNKIGTGDLITSATLPATNTWTHVAAVRSGTTLSIFVGGVRTATVTDSTNVPTSDAYIGGPSDGVNSTFNGYISNVRIIKGTAAYDPTQTTLTVPTAPVTAITNTSLLVNFDNAGIYDSTGMTNLTTYGDAKTSTTVTKFSTSSVTLDGTGDYLTIPYRAGHMSFPGDFTVEAWVKWAAGLVIASTYGGWWLRRNGNNFEFGNGDTTLMTRAYTGTDWVHVAVSRASGTLRMYVGGVLQGATVSYATAITPTAPLHVGRLSAGVAQEFQGQIENLRITQAARYTADFTPPTAPFA